MGRYAFKIGKNRLFDIRSENRLLDDIILNFAISKLNDVRKSVLPHAKTHESFAKLLIL